MGFTKITKVVSAAAIAPVNGSALATATCPAGTTLTGGGYELVSFYPVAPPTVGFSADDELNGPQASRIRWLGQ